MSIKKKLKIAMVAATAFPANHGSAASIKEMSQELAQRGHHVHIVTYPSNKNINLNGIKIHRIRSQGKSAKIEIGPSLRRPFLDFLLVIKLIRVIRKEKIDIIHAHNYESAIAGWIAKLFTRRPLLFNAVTNMVDELPTYNSIKPRFLAVALARFLDFIVPRMANKITTVSRQLYNFYTKRGINSHRITFVPPGVETTMFENADPNMIRQKLGLDHNPLIIYTGVLNRFQGIDSLLSAFQLVAEIRSDIYLILMGNMVHESQSAIYKKIATELGIEKQVIFVEDEPLNQLPHYLWAADIAVLPRSISPGFPVKLLNYMACAKPIVSFKGSAKCLEDGFNGLVIDNFDYKGFASAILSLLDDPILAKKLAKNAKKTVLEQFQWSSLVNQIENIYKKLLTPA